MAESELVKFWLACKNGFNEIAWLLAILFGGTVLTKLFGFTGPASIIAAIIAVYLVGIYHPAIKRDPKEEKPKVIEAAKEFSEGVFKSLNKINDNMRDD